MWIVWIEDWRSDRYIYIALRQIYDLIAHKYEYEYEY